MEKALKFGVIFLLLASIFSLPKDLQELIRFILIALFGILAYNSHVMANIKSLGCYIALVILYQPFIPIPLDPIIFKIINGFVALFVAYTILKPVLKVNKVLD